MTGGEGSVTARGTAEGSSPLLPRSGLSRASARDALIVDRHLDSLLGDPDRTAPDMGEAPHVDPAVRLAAERLRLELVRVHPSFRFEERLAARLADAAKKMKLPAAAGAEGVMLAIPVPRQTPGGSASNGDPSVPVAAASPAGVPAAAPAALTAAATALVPAAATAGLPAGEDIGLPVPPIQAGSGGMFAGLPDPSAVIAGLPRPVVIGGALTSAAISIAGAYMAWRAWPGLRPASAMARAVRAARQARAIQLAPGAADVPGVAGIAVRSRAPVRFDVVGAAGTLVARTRARLD